MDYPLRSIAFVADLIHPPRQHPPASLQRVHSTTFSDPHCQYQNFALVPGGAMLSNPQSSISTVSSAAFLGDRLQVREEMTGISREEFIERMERLAGHALQILGVQQFLVQQFVVRSLVNTRNFPDSREFVSRCLLNMEPADFTCLQRSPQILGVRMVFPQTPETPGIYNVRVESYAAEPRSLFIENVGIHQAPIAAANLHDLTGNFAATYDYVSSNVVDFIAQFDGREDPSGG